MVAKDRGYDIRKYAVISSCGRYRYSLTRVWDQSLPRVVFIMLNPSTADANVDDPTLRRCTGYAESWGYGGVEIVNIFAFRAKNPGDLLNRGFDVFGPENDLYLRTALMCDLKVVCAWGNSWIVNKYAAPQIAAVRNLAGKPLYCLGTTKDGTPKHPLYLRSDLQPEIWFDPDNDK